MDQNSRKIRALIRAAAELDPAASGQQIAQIIAQREPGLLQAWVADKIAAILREEHRNARPAGPYQEFFEGFRDLTERVPLKAGGGVPLAKATLTDLRYSLRITRGRAESKVQPTLRLIEGMAPYTKVQRGLNVERYCELKAAGVTAKQLRAQLKGEKAVRGVSGSVSGL